MCCIKLFTYRWLKYFCKIIRKTNKKKRTEAFPYVRSHINLSYSATNRILQMHYVEHIVLKK